MRPQPLVIDSDQYHTPLDVIGVQVTVLGNNEPQLHALLARNGVTVAAA